MLPSREELLAKAAALEEPPVGFGASWDGDTQGWFVILYAMLSRERCRHLSRLRGAGGDFRIFVGEVPPWPEAELAQAVGTELAERYGVPFTFASPERPQSGHVPAHTMTADEEASAAGAHEKFLENVEQLKEYSRAHTPSEVLGLLVGWFPTWSLPVSFSISRRRFRRCRCEIASRRNSPPSSARAASPMGSLTR